MQYFYGKILVLFNSLENNNCWAIFSDNQWRRLPTANMAILAAAAKSGNKWVAIWYDDIAVQYMYVF